MTPWLDQISHALERSGTGATLDDWLREMDAGRVWFTHARDMHGSVWFHQDGRAEVAHLFGKWNRQDMHEILGDLRHECKRRGFDIHRLEIHGRKGWPRFLAKQEEFKWV